MRRGDQRQGVPPLRAGTLQSGGASAPRAGRGKGCALLLRTRCERPSSHRPLCPPLLSIRPPHPMWIWGGRVRAGQGHGLDAGRSHVVGQRSPPPLPPSSIWPCVERVLEGQTGGRPSPPMWAAGAPPHCLAPPAPCLLWKQAAVKADYVANVCHLAALGQASAFRIGRAARALDGQIPAALPARPPHPSFFPPPTPPTLSRAPISSPWRPPPAAPWWPPWPPSWRPPCPWPPRPPPPRPPACRPPRPPPRPTARARPWAPSPSSRAPTRPPARWLPRTCWRG